MTLKAILLGALLALPLCAFAEPDVHVNAESGVFGSQRAKVEADLADGTTYSEITARDRAEVVQALAEMETILGGRTVDQLSEAEKARLINAQELVNTRLTKASDDSRLVCRREPVAGSRLPRSQCLTVAERRRIRENAQDSMQQFDRGFDKSSAFGPGGTGGP